jgi:flagellin-like hook-associated protein FlgL
MAGVVPIPTSRVSTLLIRQRLQAQLQGDQLDIFRLQNQISTGRRITTPSEDAPAAQRAITLQRLIERKTQLRSNVETGLSFLTATDVALNDVASLLGNIRGLALGASSTTATQEEREVAATEVNQAIDQLMAIGNRRFRGRYLFAGSQTNVQPYQKSGNAIAYSGDERQIQTYTDLDVLFSTNAPGARVFGGISEEVIAGQDLNPQLSHDTLLSSLRGGRGISPNGALRISDGSNSVTIDITRAVTVGDVVRLIEENPPAGRQITVNVAGSELTLQLDAPGGGSLTVTEVGSGRAAAELGILETTGVSPPGTLIGDDLDPTLLKTSRLEDLFGTKARARLISAGDNNDILIEAAANGAASNGITIQLVDDAAAGAEYADVVGSTLRVHIAAGESSANDVIDAINTQGAFSAQIDPTDTFDPGLAGAGVVALTATATTSGGSGTTFSSAGLVIENGGQSFTIDFAGAVTVEDLLNRLNGSGAGLYAAINAAGTGIDVRSRMSGSDFWIRENGGVTAAQLGIRVEELNHELDIPTAGTTDFTIVVNLGNIDLDPEDETTSLGISLTGASTVQEVLDRINNHVDNNVGGVALVASLTADNEIQIVDSNGRPLTIQATPGSEAAEYFGLVAPDGLERIETSGTVAGTAITFADSGSVFTTLLRLRDALTTGDVNAMERAIARIDEDINRATFARSEVGAREQALVIAQRNLEDEDVELRSALSDEIDVDIVEAISNLTARQVSLQASLQTIGNILQLSLLDFI